MANHLLYMKLLCVSCTQNHERKHCTNFRLPVGSEPYSSLMSVCIWPLATNALASHLVLPHVEDLP